jgi:hypothetical protein
LIDGKIRALVRKQWRGLGCIARRGPRIAAARARPARRFLAGA